MESEKNYVKINEDPNVEYKIVYPSMEQFEALEERLDELEVAVIPALRFVSTSPEDAKIIGLDDRFTDLEKRMAELEGFGGRTLGHAK